MYIYPGIAIFNNLEEIDTIISKHPWTLMKLVLLEIERRLNCFKNVYVGISARFLGNTYV
jgi:hypothetical protein